MFNEFKRYEEEFAQWRLDEFPNVQKETYDFIYHVNPDSSENAERNIKLWAHQFEGILRVIYSYEILDKKKLLLNIVTGGGKTAIIGAIMAWLRYAHGVTAFVALCPNTIVRDRLEDDFKDGKVFKKFSLLPPNSQLRPEDMVLHIMETGAQATGMLGANIMLANIQQLYQSNISGKRNMAYLINNFDKFAVFNDEAHNTPAPEYTNILEILDKRLVFRLDTTATPDRADFQPIDSEMIYEYGISEALYDGIAKNTVVYRPNINTVQLTYTDIRTGEKRKVEEIDWDEIDRKGISPTQWVTDAEPMRQQMAIALARLREQERWANGRFKPILFVVAVSKADAKQAQTTLENYFKFKPTLLVTEDSNEWDRKAARVLGKPESKYKAVVSVLMLREGWDVPEVSVILLLRKFSSKVYGQQVIGRGLRKILRNKDEPEVLRVVDHPKLEHDWLWRIIQAKKREDVAIEDEFDEKEDVPPPPPKQELIHPELVIDIPEPTDEGIPDWDEITIVKELEPFENWVEVVDGFEYPVQGVEITKVEIESVTGIELGLRKRLEVVSAPDRDSSFTAEFNPDDDLIRQSIKDEVIRMSEELLIEAGIPVAHKGKVYNVILNHINKRLLDGNTIGLAERPQLILTLRNLERVRSNFQSTPALIQSIVRFG